MSENVYNKMMFTINTVTFLFSTQFQNPLNGITKNDDCETMASVNLGKYIYFYGLSRFEPGGMGLAGTDPKKNIYQI